MSGEQGNEAVVRRFYDELWNRWRLDLADEIVAEAVLPDWHNRVDEILSAGNRVVTRMTWTGTHEGGLGEVRPTGARVEYEGAAFFRLADGLIEEAWVVGDTQELWRALGRLRD